MKKRGFVVMQESRKDTVFSFHHQLVIAKEIWDHDKIKKELVEAVRFSIHYLWEHEIKTMSDAQILDWFCQRRSKQINA